MRNISARYAFDGNKWIENPIISLDRNDKIISVKEKSLKNQELPSLEYYHGILVPGFINSHTHTELSFKNSQYQSQNQISDFIKHVQNIRKSTSPLNHIDFKKLFRQIEKSGTVFMADIINSETGINSKERSTLKFINFYEFYTLTSKKISEQIKHYKKLKDKSVKSEIYPSLHSPYTVSDSNHNNLSRLFYNGSFITSMHYRESSDEIKLNESDSALRELYKSISSDYTPYFKDNLFENSAGKLLRNCRKLILVHNTFITQKDISNLIKWSKKNNSEIMFTLCPRSNYNISGKLPDIKQLRESGFKLSLGTDSLLSSPDLSVFNEMLFIHKEKPEIPLSDLLKWITINPARFLGIDKQFGSFESGKSPGINLLEFANLNIHKIPENVNIKRLI